MTVLFKHKDGRSGTGPGAWFAIKEALGKGDASDLVDRSEDRPWEYDVTDVDGMTSVRHMPLIVDGEEIGMFHEIREAVASKAKRVVASDEHVDSRLSSDRDEKGEKPPAGTLEVVIGPDRKSNEDQVRQSIEKNLRDKKTDGPNSDASGLVEKRLNEAKTTLYPHRNEEAWARTGEKRPVNSLPEELGKASDDKKRERWSAANKAGTKRALDKDVGKQLDLPKTKIKQKAFNLKAERESGLKKYARYLEYRASKAGGWSDRFASVRNIDVRLGKVMSNNKISKEQMAEVEFLKDVKAESLGLKVSAYQDMPEEERLRRLEALDDPRWRPQGLESTEHLDPKEFDFWREEERERLKHIGLSREMKEREEKEEVSTSQQQAVADDVLIQKTIGKLERAKQMSGGGQPQKVKIQNPFVADRVRQSRPDLALFIG